MARARRSFGYLRKLPSGRWQASYLDPSNNNRINAPTTFTTKGDGDTWLSIQRAALETGRWRGSDDRITVGEYAEQWFGTYSVGARTYYRTRGTYDRAIRPTFGSLPMSSVTVSMVRQWVASFPKNQPWARVEPYKLLGRLYRDAISDGIVSASPVNVAGATKAPPHRKGHALTAAEVESLAAKMPKQRRLAVQLAAYCALRPGEVLALRARNIDQKRHVLHVQETASTVSPGVKQIGPPKTPASARTVNYPAELHDAMSQQLREYATPGPRGHLFPSPQDADRPVTIAAFRGNMRTAAQAANLEDVKPHDLRHTGLTLAAGTGATVSELMARAGHTSPTVAMRYQHSAQQRDRVIADALGAAIGAKDSDEKNSGDEGDNDGDD